MSDKSRLCNVCGRLIPENADLVVMKDGLGPAHLECALETREEYE